MSLIRKDKSELAKVGKSIEITNKLIKEIDRRKLVPADDFRVPIPDENFRKYLLERHGIENDGASVSYGDVKDVTEVPCHSQTIESLEGIEYFTALTELRCFNNQLTSLDVSKNTALELLLCEDNQLTSLDFSKNTALKYLYCYNNELTSLDISKNTALRRLCLSGNPGTWWEELEREEWKTN